MLSVVRCASPQRATRFSSATVGLGKPKSTAPLLSSPSPCPRGVLRRRITRNLRKSSPKSHEKWQKCVKKSRKLERIREVYGLAVSPMSPTRRIRPSRDARAEAPLLAMASNGTGKNNLLTITVLRRNLLGGQAQRSLKKKLKALDFFL